MSVVEAEKKAGERKRGGGHKKLPGLTVKDGYTVHPFDTEFGVRTSGLIAGRHLRIGKGSDRHITAYYAVAPSVFDALLARWRRAPYVAPLDQYTFLDLGAGMGRAMLLASQHNFRQVVGVELHSTLAEMARKNMKLWRDADRATAPMTVHCQDVLDFRFPDGPCVLFLFNPFGAAVLKKLLQKLAAEFADRPRQLDLLYVNCEQDHVLEMQTGFCRFFQGPVRRSKKDAIADFSIMANQPDGEYASTNYEDCSIWRWVGMGVNQTDASAGKAE